MHVYDSKHIPNLFLFLLLLVVDFDAKQVAKIFLGSIIAWKYFISLNIGCIIFFPSELYFPHYILLPSLQLLFQCFGEVSTQNDDRSYYVKVLAMK